MDRKEKLELFKYSGWSCDSETGYIFDRKGNQVKGKSNGYVRCNIWYNKKTICVLGHQLIWFLTTGKVPTIIDHINRDKSDNRILNLREVTQQQNSFNRDVKGYYWHSKANKYQANIVINDKTIYLGCFKNEEDASSAYQKAKLRHHII